MTILITIVHVIVCFILIAVILLQAGRGQGLTGPSFGSGNVQSLFGTRAADFLSKATTVAAICFLFTCIALDFIEARKSRSLMEGARQTAPVDVDAIRKALEKVKEEQKAANPQAAAVPAVPAVPEVPATPETAPAAQPASDATTNAASAEKT
ncbi:MAG: preprotein translocase subunit SecG [Candidatus Omnitrophica bacterium]|nr:preprotein translocase subunit SecG [Candidatus Omnitrophota bacterium]